MLSSYSQDHREYSQSVASVHEGIISHSRIARAVVKSRRKIGLGGTTGRRAQSCKFHTLSCRPTLTPTVLGSPSHGYGKQLEMSDTVVKRQHKKSQHVSTKRVGLTGNSISTKMDRSRKPRAVKTMSLLQSASRFFLISVSCMAILAATFLSPWRTVRSLDHKLVVFGRPLSAEYASTEEQDSRSTRFPSVDDRVRIYMGRWYEPPCEDSDKVGFKRITVNETIGRSGQPESFFLVRELPQFDRPKRRRIFVLTNSVQTTRAFYLDRHALKNCSDQNLRNYCRDSRDFILPALERLNANSTTSSGIPTFLQ